MIQPQALFCAGCRMTGCLVTVVASFSLCGCLDDPASTGIVDLLGNESPASEAHSHSTGAEETSDIDRPVPASVPPWPKVELESTEYNFGNLQVGGHLDHAFTIRNVGDAPLRLAAGESTCQCTRFELDTEEVAPGDTATLHVSWQGKKVDPSFHHGGSVFTNDPKRSDIRFTVRGRVDAVVTMQPERIWYAGNVSSGEPTKFTARMFSRVFPKLTIESVLTGSEFTSLDFIPMTKAELVSNDALCGYRVEVTIRPDFPVGVLSENVKIELKELEEHLEVLLEARRYGNIHIQPMAGTLFNERERGVDLGTFSARNGRKADLMLIVDQIGFDMDLQFLEVETDPKVLRVSLLPIGKRSATVGRYRMTVEIPRGTNSMKRLKGNIGTIRCRTNHPSGEEIQLRVRLQSF